MDSSTSPTATTERAGRRVHPRKALGKSERVAARLSPDQKQLLRRAADLEHRTLTDFLVASGLRSAEEVIRRHTVITLSEQGARAFMEAVSNPQPANAYLRRAAERYKAAFGDR
jgi:uncharacterized protein (DUF1778 family)